MAFFARFPEAVKRFANYQETNICVALFGGSEVFSRMVEVSLRGARYNEKSAPCGIPLESPAAGSVPYPLLQGFSGL